MDQSSLPLRLWTPVQTDALDLTQLKEAREEFRACLKYRPHAERAAKARHAIAEINEKIGTE